MPITPLSDIGFANIFSHSVGSFSFCWLPLLGFLTWCSPICLFCYHLCFLPGVSWFLMKGFSWKVSHSGFSPFWIIFINVIIVQLHSFAVPIQFSQHQFIEETVPIVYPWLLCCKQLTIYAWVYFWAILFHWSMSCFYANTILFSYERTVI